MTDQELEGFAAQAFNLARTEFQRKEKFNWLLASFHRGTGLHRMTKIEALVIELAGEDWMNDSAKKERVGYVLRIATHLMPPDAVALVSIADRWKPTDAFNALSEADQKKIMDGPRASRADAASLGLLTVDEVMVCWAQTPSRVCSYQRTLNELEDSQPLVQFGPMELFEGNFKLFGEVEIPPEAAEIFARRMAEKGYL